VHTVSLYNAYYVPTQPLNILNSSDVRVLGGAFHLDDSFEPSYVRWSRSSCPVHQAVKWKNCIPYIHCTAVVRLHAVRKVIPPHLGCDVTHATFGHMGQAKMKHLVNEGYIDASKLCQDAGYACHACEEANAKLEPYPSKYDLAATHVNHTLHADLLQFPVVTPDGNQYLLLVEDEYTLHGQCFAVLQSAS
jgi:hypothetical protein